MIGKDSGVMKAWEATVRRTQAVAKKRANSIFGTISLGHSEEDIYDFEDNGNGPLETYHDEKVLSNGDYYTGEWAENFPHGQGKYLWTDGCMYVGEWYKGKTMGKGRFSWPSGATYEGEFNGGFIDGAGTYIGTNGDTYKGQWIMNLKQGHGFKSYANGDWFDGEWKNGVQEGQGRYEWNDGGHYVGEWKNGYICGKGLFAWPNGNKFEGLWEDGLPKGSGTLKWPDGSYYVGNWSKDGKDQNGTYHPPESSSGEEEGGGHADWNPQELYNELRRYSVCPGDNVSVWPSQKKLAVWRSAKGGESGKPRRMSVDGRASVGLERPSDRMNLWDGGGGGGGGGEGGDGSRTPPLPTDLDEEVNIDDAVEALAPLQPLKAPKKSKRQGETISKGHKNFELMLNLQLGIRYILFGLP